MRLTICIVFASFFSYELYSQNHSERISNQILDFSERNPTEKLYVDLNKSTYLSGETIWMKTYLISGFHNQPSPLSGVVYLELVSSDGKLVEQITVESREGFGASQISLPNDIKTGNYLLTGYTNWMKNFGSEYFFQKHITIFNIQDDKPTHEPILNTLDTVLFFPESGNLVSGLETRVAFKAFNSNGSHRNIEGVIRNEKKDVCLIKTTLDGMGVLTFTPENSGKYTLTVDGKNFSLPVVHEKGQVLSVINAPTNDKLKLIIKNNDSRVSELQLVIHRRGLPTISSEIRFKNGVSLLEIDKNNFLPGVNTITLFRNDGTPLLERKFFIEGNDQVTVQISTSQESYSLREEVTVSLSLDYQDSPIATKLSCAVTNDWEVELDTMEDNAISYLILSGDLPGIIHNPRQYFDTSDESRWLKQDLLMMVYGWSRYKWEDLLEREYLAFPMERGFEITGKVGNLVTNKGVGDSEVTYLLPYDEGPLLGKVSTDDNGNFQIKNLIFEGEAQLVLDARKKKDNNNVRITVDSVPDQKLLKTPFINYSQKSLQDLSLGEMLASGLKRQEIDSAFDFDNQFILLDGLEISDKSYEEYAFPENVYGPGDHSFVISEVQENLPYQSVFELLQGRLPGVEIYGSAGRYTVRIRGNNSFRSSTPAIFLDNIEIPLDRVELLPVSIIKGVEVYSGPSAAIFGANGASGVLAFFTKRGEFKPTYRNLPNTARLDLSGFTKYQEFYSPDYGVKDERHIKPDYRSTVFWEPFLQTNEQGKTEFSFYSTDEPMNMTMIVEGVSDKGIPIYGVKKIKVRKEQ